MAALVDRGLRAMFLHKLKLVVRALFVGGVIVAGNAALARQGWRVLPRSGERTPQFQSGVDARVAPSAPAVDKNRQARLLLEEVATVYKSAPWVFDEG